MKVVHVRTGDQYKVTLTRVADAKCKNAAFYIAAECLQTKRRSNITNLNYMLDLLEVDPLNPKYEDSQWTLPIAEAVALFTRAREALADWDTMAQLEAHLDDDRVAGEWEDA